jgi:hypothetical protein
MKSCLKPRYLLWCGLATLVSACANLEPRADRWTPPPVGSSWEVAQRNSGSYGKDVQMRVTRGDATWQGNPVVTLSSSLGMTSMLAPDGWRQVAIVGRDGKPLQSWDVPVGLVFPLTVGKTWRTSHKLTIHATGKEIAYDFPCKVESHEDVAVRAGTFKAFKTVCLTTLGNDDSFWYSPDVGLVIKTFLKRDEKSPFGPGTQQTELVSVPVLKQ